MRIACLAIGLLWSACAGAGTLYRLPWADGLSFMFTQAPGGRITSHFTKARLHAIDIAMPEGTAVLAARAGVVDALVADHGASPGEEPLTYEGNFVRVRHADGTAAVYAHLKHRGVAVAAGQAVEAGQLLGYSGASGEVEQPHLHFAVIRFEKNSSGWLEEVSVPVRFYVGVPPVAIAPRAALRVEANYAGVAFAWKRPALQPGDEIRAWGVLALWLACGLAGLAWFWRFSKQ
jgi:murein DD-endopeptidase MepM/ murein hydrolase activator NlpD